MSVVNPEINDLLDKTENNPFLLSAIAAKRACDINNMVRSVNIRATNAEDVSLDVIDEAIELSGQDTVTQAMNEIHDGLLGYDKERLDDELRDDEEICF